MKKGRLPLLIFLTAAAAAISFFFAPAVFMFISKQSDKMAYYPPQRCLEILQGNKDARTLFFCSLALTALAVWMMVFSGGRSDYRAELYSVTPDIRIPKPLGQYQHGSAWFMSGKEFEEMYPRVTINLHSPLFKFLIQEGRKDIAEVKQLRFKDGELKPKKFTPIQKTQRMITEKRQHTESYLKSQAKLQKNLKTEPFKKVGGGMIAGYSKRNFKEYVNLLTEDLHTATIGSTGSGKSRHLVIQSIICQLLAGESVFISDIKGELYQYTCKLLERLGVNTIVLDYRDMSKSMSYNFLQPVIDKLKAGDVNKASQLCRDYANMIAGKKSEQTEAIWHDGKVAVLAAAMMACTYDNMDKPMNQNLCYVYEWLTRMCAERPGKGLLLNEYLAAVGENHPANLILAQANVAPSKTRGSFYTSACTALMTFTDRQLYHICSKSDFKLTDLATKKTAMFVILPESKTTFYPLVSLLVAQIYEALDDYSNNVIGSGRLPRRVHFDLDEFGNFSPFPDFNMMLTVGRSKGIIFNIFLQSYAQLKEKYSEVISEIIQGNCTNKIYLKSADDTGTNKNISDSLSTYTTSSYSLSSNSSKYSSSGGTSMNLTERKLLYPDELKRLRRPYMLVISEERSKVTVSPDLSRWAFNIMLGLGNQKHNEKVRALRQRQRPKLHDVDKPPEYIGMWLPANFLNFKVNCMRNQGKI